MASRYTSIRKAEPRIWRIWYRMNKRCENNELYYEDVEVSDHYSREISGEQGFINFVDDFWDTYQDDLTIDRIDPAGHYTYDNMKWSTQTEQNRNTRFHKHTERGQALTKMHEKWGHSTAVKQRFWARAKRGWSYDDIINTPPSLSNRVGKSNSKDINLRRKQYKKRTIWQKIRSII